MARDPKTMRKAYEYKLGKDLAAKLTDKQITILSEYYNSLSAKESSDIDSKIIQGRNDTELHEMAIGMVEETESKKTPPKNTRRLVRNQSEKKKAVKKQIDLLKDASGGKVSEELDSLLNIIREEGDKKEDFLDTDNILKEFEKSKNKKDTTSSSKLAKRIVEKSQSIQKTKPQKFEADPEAAKILGIDPFDLTEDEYKTLLKEKMIKDRMGQKTDSGDAEIISNEFKRVKKGTPIQKSDKVYKSTISPVKLLPGTKVSKVKDKKQDTEEVSESVDNMNETLEGIDSVLKDILRQDKKEDEREKREAEKSKQASEEKSKEQTKKEAENTLKTFKTPKIPFLDRVKEFFKNILIGGAVGKLLDWINDPENQETIEKIENFFTKNLDKITTGLLLLVGLNIGGKILLLLKGITSLARGAFNGIKRILGIRKPPNQKPPNSNTKPKNNTPNKPNTKVQPNTRGSGNQKVGRGNTRSNFSLEQQRNNVTNQNMLKSEGPRGPLDGIKRFLRGKLAEFETTNLGRTMAKTMNWLKNNPAIKGAKNFGGRLIKSFLNNFEGAVETVQKASNKEGLARVGQNLGKFFRRSIGILNTILTIGEISSRAKSGMSPAQAILPSLFKAALTLGGGVLGGAIPIPGLNFLTSIAGSFAGDWLGGQIQNWADSNWSSDWDTGVFKGFNDAIKEIGNSDQSGIINSLFPYDSTQNTEQSAETTPKPVNNIIPRNTKSSPTETNELTQSNEGTGDVNIPPSEPAGDINIEMNDSSNRLSPVTKPIPPKPPKSDPDISFLPLSMRKGNQQLTSSSQGGQKALSGFSPEDVNNMSIPAVRSIYNAVA